MHRWNKFPHDNRAFTFPGEKLKGAWAQLHRGDCEPFPADEELQKAWRSYHQGEFQQAAEQADAIGLTAHAVANKATGIYATYLEQDQKRQIACYQSAIERAQSAIDEFPDDPNSHYFHAFTLGRYSQSISIVKALKQGIGGKIQKSLKRTLELQPKHAEAHTALGMYHAEIIDKVGKLLGGVTYGASESSALEHFGLALSLTPSSPIANIEYGNGLYLLHGDKKINQVSDLYIKASEMEPHDAMEKLDIESALAELE
jgi:tetratricopeptide (TPR) repeat protein